MKRSERKKERRRRQRTAQLWAWYKASLGRPVTTADILKFMYPQAEIRGLLDGPTFFDALMNTSKLQKRNWVPIRKRTMWTDVVPA